MAALEENISLLLAKNEYQKSYKKILIEDFTISLLQKNNYDAIVIIRQLKNYLNLIIENREDFEKVSGLKEDVLQLFFSPDSNVNISYKNSDETERITINQYLEHLINSKTYIDDVRILEIIRIDKILTLENGNINVYISILPFMDIVYDQKETLYVDKAIKQISIIMNTTQIEKLKLKEGDIKISYLVIQETI